MRKLIFLVFAISCMLLAAGQAKAELVGHWALDAGSGTVAADTSGKGNNGTLLPVSGPPAWAAGKSGSALHFDNTNDVLSINNSASLNMNTAVGITVAFWMKPDTDTPVGPTGGAAQKDGLIDKGTGGATTGWQLYHETDGTIKAFQGAKLAVGADQFSLSSTVAVGSSKWTHIAYVADYDGGTPRMRLFIDGVLDATLMLSTATNLQDNTTDIIVGKNSSNYFYGGSIDDIQIYNNILSDAEIAQLAGVPEPATVCLLGLGALAMLKRRNA